MNLALFDFDGTITTREMLPDFFRAVIPRRRRLLGQLLLAPLIVGYKLGLVSGVSVRSAIVLVGMKGLSVAQYQTCGLAFARDVLPGVLRPEAMARIRWHQEQGDRVVIVSGAFDVYLAHWCQQHRVELICSALESHQGRLTGRYLGQQCVRQEKAIRVQTTCNPSAYASIYAYGDTPEDADLLALADHKFYQGKPIAGAPP